MFNEVRYIMKLVFTCLFVFVYSSIAFSQTLIGWVIDEKSQPLPYANVVLLSLPDSAFVTGTVSDESGAFTLKANPTNLLLRVSSIGYATYI